MRNGHVTAEDKGVKTTLGYRKLDCTKKFKNWLCWLSLSTATAGINTLGISNVSEKGKNPIVVSRKSASIWESNVAKNLLGLEIGLGGTYQSASYVDALNIYQVPAYLVVDASMRYQLATSNKDMWKIGLFVKT